MKNELYSFIQESFDSIEVEHVSILENHIEENLGVSNSYLRLGSTGFNQIVEFYRRAYDKNIYVPIDESEKFMFEKLQTGKQGYKKGAGGKMTKVTLDTPQKNNDNDKSFKVYRATDKEHEGLPIVKTIYWGMDNPNGRSSIKNDDKGRSDAFFARHNCSTKKDKNSAGWWACYAPELFGDKLKLAGGKNRW